MKDAVWEGRRLVSGRCVAQKAGSHFSSVIFYAQWETFTNIKGSVIQYKDLSYKWSIEYVGNVVGLSRNNPPTCVITHNVQRQTCDFHCQWHCSAAVASVVK